MVTERDIEILSRTIYGEARGDSSLGKLSVGWVVVNRMSKYKHKSLSETCLKSIHFSCWNNSRDHDVNQLAMMTADLSSSTYAQCVIAAIGAAHGLKPDPTGGSTHYHTFGISPKWAEGKTYISIGKHKFYNDVD